MQKIPGVNYLSVGDQELLADPHFRLTLKEATEEKYVTTVNFCLRDCEVQINEMTTDEDGNTTTQLITRALADLPPGKEVDTLYGMALDPHQPAVKLLLAEAHKNLLYKRQRHIETYGDAKPEAPAGLVVCRNQSMADATALVLQEISGKMPVIVHGKAGKDMKKRIAKFRASDDEWCVSVGMISEGVDIPRIKTIAYLTNKKTDLIFAQIVGRAQRVRYTPDGKQVEELATVLLPYHPELDRYAHDFMAQQGVHAFENPEEEELLKKTRDKNKSVDEELREVLEAIKEANEKAEKKRWQELVSARGLEEINYLNGVRVASSQALQIFLDLGCSLDQAQEALIELSRRHLLVV